MAHYLLRTNAARNILCLSLLSLASISLVFAAPRASTAKKNQNFEEKNEYNNRSRRYTKGGRYHRYTNAEAAADSDSDAVARNRNRNRNRNTSEASFDESPISASVNSPQTVTQDSAVTQVCSANNTAINNPSAGSTVTPVQATDFIFAFSDATQIYEGDGTTFQDVTFNVNGPLSGWTHVAGSANFTAPSSGLYLVSYRGNIQLLHPAGINNASAGLRAVFGPAETPIPGSDSGTAFQISVTNDLITTVTTSFLFNAIQGQDLKLQLIATPIVNASPRLIAAPIGLPGITTTVSITITRIN